MLDPDRLLGARMKDRAFSWTCKDAILYALGAGCGADDLAFVYERDQVSLPTFATVVCNVKMFDPGALGIAYAGLVHFGQRLHLHIPFPPEGEAMLSKRIAGLWDRGEGRGALIAVETQVRAPDGSPIATVVNEMLARFDGGFGGVEGAPEAAPTISAEIEREMATSGEQALLFRLSGDWNPLHADPEAARAAGFDGPILHGMCTYAMCCRAVMAEYGIAADDVQEHDARFSAPVFPGETLVVAMKRTGREIGFSARVGDRQVVRNGRTVLRP